MSDEFSNNVRHLEKRLMRLTAHALTDFKMLEDGDRVMVCLSGGKDSYTMLRLLMQLQKRAPIRFELIAMNLDQGQPGFPKDVLPNYLSKLGIEYHIIEQDTYSVVKEKIPEGKTTCSLCSRLRRGAIYRTAREIGATKIALGHHRDDLVETLFINLFFTGSLKGMAPKLLTDDGEHIVIRPLTYCSEADIARYARALKFPIIPCDLCGSQPNLQRQKIKEMLRDWEREYPGRTEKIFAAMGNVKTSHLVDLSLYKFSAITKSEGAPLFDPPSIDHEWLSASGSIENSLANIKISVIN